LSALAYTRDGLIESIGWADTTNSNFLFAVQWHPEWMDKTDVPSGKIAEMFLKKAKNYHQSRIRN
ncbi:MAG: gamma-glutamyl-gamma-aminobutyrate hydrolase family protein, partial [Bacteroidales bacterium]